MNSRAYNTDIDGILLLDPDIDEMLELLRSEQIHFSEGDFSFRTGSDNFYDLSPNMSLEVQEDLFPTTLSASDGGDYISKMGHLLGGYDESIATYSALEGLGVASTHSFVLHGSTDFIPFVFLTFYFYTKSDVFRSKTRLVQHTDDIGKKSRSNQFLDRNKFLIDHVPDNTLIFIDGPLIGGQHSSYNVELNDLLLRKNCIPIFLVKNSLSSLVTSHVKELKGRFNSDLHWAYDFLKTGERTPFFKYEAEENLRFAKIFTYLKVGDLSPFRVEFHPSTRSKYFTEIPAILNSIYFLVLANGIAENLQVRTVVIAEKFAREVLRLYKIDAMLKSSKFSPTMNQRRFG